MSTRISKDYLLSLICIALSMFRRICYFPSIFFLVYFGLDTSWVTVHWEWAGVRPRPSPRFEMWWGGGGMTHRVIRGEVLGGDYCQRGSQQEAAVTMVTASHCLPSVRAQFVGVCIYSSILSMHVISPNLKCGLFFVFADVCAARYIKGSPCHCCLARVFLIPTDLKELNNKKTLFNWGELQQISRNTCKLTAASFSWYSRPSSLVKKLCIKLQCVMSLVIYSCSLSESLSDSVSLEQ